MDNRGPLPSNALRFRESPLRDVTQTERAIGERQARVVKRTFSWFGRNRRLGKTVRT